MALNEELLYQLLGQRIRRARQHRCLSQADLADKVGLTRVSIVNIEAGRQRPPLHLLWLIAEELNVQSPDLIPTRAEYLSFAGPVTLDASVIREIEDAANGDPLTRRALTEFIQKARQ